MVTFLLDDQLDSPIDTLVPDHMCIVYDVTSLPVADVIISRVTY